MTSAHSRLVLGIALLACMGLAACASLLDMLSMAATDIPSNVRDAALKAERREEVAQGIDNLLRMQTQIASLSWWLAFGAALRLAVVLLWGFRKPQVA